MEGEVSKDKKTTSKADKKKLKEELDNENNLQESTDSEKKEMEEVKEETSLSYTSECHCNFNNFISVIN